jgi:hypothetical protein
MSLMRFELEHQPQRGNRWVETLRSFGFLIGFHNCSYFISMTNQIRHDNYLGSALRLIELHYSQFPHLPPAPKSSCHRCNLSSLFNMAPIPAPSGTPSLWHFARIKLQECPPCSWKDSLVSSRHYWYWHDINGHLWETWMFFFLLSGLEPFW